MKAGIVRGTFCQLKTSAVIWREVMSSSGMVAQKKRGMLLRLSVYPIETRRGRALAAGAVSCERRAT